MSAAIAAVAPSQEDVVLGPEIVKLQQFISAGKTQCASRLAGVWRRSKSYVEQIINGIQTLIERGSRRKWEGEKVILGEAASVVREMCLSAADVELESWAAQLKEKCDVAFSTVTPGQPAELAHLVGRAPG